MALAQTFGIGLFGLTGTVIEVETDISAQLPAFVLVGLPDASLSEATSRVRAACTNSGFAFPSKKVVVNLSPASVPKSGASFDLAIAISVLGAMEQVSPQSLQDSVFFGELGLNGMVRAVPGVLPMMMAARASGFSRAFVPVGNAAEAALVGGIEVCPVSNLRELVLHLKGQLVLPPVPNLPPSNAAVNTLDLSQVIGQAQAVEALVVAAAGGHHLSMIGAPGSGKTMLAERMPGILPQLTVEEALEVAAVESIIGDGQRQVSLNLAPRFVAPHHSTSVAALIGGGSGVPRPGAVSRAHRGVLFLDEALEFNSSALDSLREPLEGGRVVINRSAGSAQFPARFQMVLAANPCPCGLYGVIDKDCRCSVPNIRRYASRLSGPILDRIDIRIVVQPVSISAAAGLAPDGLDTATAFGRVEVARAAARLRLASAGYSLNAHVPGPILRRKFKPATSVMKDLDRMLALGRASMRGYDRCLRLAWTLADLDGATSPTREHIHRAVALRGSDELMAAA